MKNLVIFASGNGSNALNLIRHFKGSDIAVKAVFCNKTGAGVIQKALDEGVPVFLFDRKMSSEFSSLDTELEKYAPDLIVLAGYLWLFPARLLAKYRDRVINLHPALLPKYGGKGMWGEAVHSAVLANAESETGITIHYVNEHYDEGRVIAQARCEVQPGDSPASLAARIHELEHKLLPETIEKLLR